jgi:hypothetical protein
LPISTEWILETHDAQGRRDGASARDKDHAHHQDQHMPPGRRRERALERLHPGRQRVRHAASSCIWHAHPRTHVSGEDSTIAGPVRIRFLWVEQSFEFFAASMSAYLLMAIGLVSRKLAERAVYFELILIFLGGVLGTGHHLYWAGGPSMWVPLGSMFSFIEVLPLVLLVIEAIQQYRLIRARQAFNYTLAYTYLIGAAFWNFVDAGVFGGGTLNAPLINYYEHGTFLTLNHAHTALFGAFGLLAIGLIYFCLRYVAGDRLPFSERLGLWRSGSTTVACCCGFC